LIRGAKYARPLGGVSVRINFAILLHRAVCYHLRACVVSRIARFPGSAALGDDYNDLPYVSASRSMAWCTV